MRSTIVTLRSYQTFTGKCSTIVYDERIKIGDADKYVLLMWDFSRGQKTEAVTSLLQQQKVLNWYVPKNMTDYFQVLNLTVKKIGKGLYET